MKQPLQPKRNSENRICLDAVIAAIDTLRYTPASVPILDLTLEHQSEQQEAGQMRKSAFTIDAKIIGEAARQHYQVGDVVRVAGFLNLRNPRYPKLILHIQDIEKH